MRSPNRLSARSRPRGAWPGMLESAYEACLAFELLDRGWASNGRSRCRSSIGGDVSTAAIGSTCSSRARHRRSEIDRTIRTRPSASCCPIFGSWSQVGLLINFNVKWLQETASSGSSTAFLSKVFAVSAVSAGSALIVVSDLVMIRPILKYGDTLLHDCAQAVDAITTDVDRLIDDMIETMYAAPGVGLAAPQVGVPLRIFVVDLSVGRDPDGLIVMINPEFVERDGMQLEEEGCLSVPGFNATVVRPSRAVVEGARSHRAPSPAARRHRPARARASSTRWIISTARCSSTACAASSATSSSGRSAS